MSGPKVERLGLRQAARADISPVMTLVPDATGVIGQAFESARAHPPVIEGIDVSGERHTLRLLTDTAEVAALQQLFSQESLYIADGHHRYESAMEYRDRRAAEAGAAWTGEEPENFVLMGIVRAADAGLIVGPTHRLLHSAVPADAVTRIGERFQVQELVPIPQDIAALTQPLADASRAGSVALVAVGLVPGQAHLLIADDRTRRCLPSDLPESWVSLNPALLQYAILAPVFDIDDAALRAGAVISYAHEAKTALAAVLDGRATAAFLLPPPTLSQIFTAADGGDRMPQKSTYFLPKLPTGVVIYAFDKAPEKVG